MRLAFLAVLLAGCGGPLEGSWVAPDQGCVTWLTLLDGRYSSGLACDLAGGGRGADDEVGTYADLDGHALLLSPESGSCSLWVHDAVQVGYETRGRGLILHSRTGDWHLTYGSPGRIVRRGCWIDGVLYDGAGPPGDAP